VKLKLQLSDFFMKYRICIENVYNDLIGLEIVGTDGKLLYPIVKASELPSFDLVEGKVYLWDEDKKVVIDNTFLAREIAKEKYDKLLERE